MAPGVDDLTDREREVLRLLLGGHTAKSAAAELDLSVHTINDHLREARRKLGVASSREAARILGDHEDTTPQNHAPDTIGMADPTVSPHTPIPSATPGRRNRVAWIIGGILMLAAIVAVALFSFSPASTAEEEQKVEAIMEQNIEAQTAALDWLKLIDAKRYRESWTQAGPIFKSAITADGWATQAEPVRQPLGDLVSRKLNNVQAPTSLPGAPEGDYRVIAFDSDFSAAANKTETAVLAKTDGEWGVVGYFIR